MTTVLLILGIAVVIVLIANQLNKKKKITVEEQNPSTNYNPGFSNIIGESKPQETLTTTVTTTEVSVENYKSQPANTLEDKIENIVVEEPKVEEPKPIAKKPVKKSTTPVSKPKKTKVKKSNGK